MYIRENCICWTEIWKFTYEYKINLEEKDHLGHSLELAHSIQVEWAIIPRNLNINIRHAKGERSRAQNNQMYNNECKEIMGVSLTYYSVERVIKTRGQDFQLRWQSR